MRLFKKTHDKFERIIHEEIDEPRERETIELITEAEDVLRDDGSQPARGHRGPRRRSGN